jgi:hypothetical protein
MTALGALQPAPAEPTVEELATLEQLVGERERELDAFKTDLLELQNRYLAEIGVLYAELGRLDADVADAEIAAGARIAEEVEPIDPKALADFSCSNRAEPSDDLKRAFRDVAKAVHPDLAADEDARCRRHSLMAEANRAYAERDTDRLRLMLHAWQHDPDAVIGHDPEANRERRQRRIVSMRVQLASIDAEFEDLRRSAIARLKVKIDDARAQGWSLFDEMLRQVKTEIGSAKATLVKLRSRRASARR